MKPRGALKLFLASGLCVVAHSQPRGDFSALATGYATVAHPLLRQFCHNCHSAASRAGDLDLARFAELSELRRDAKVWIKVAEMLAQGEMPPKSAPQPSPDQRTKLREWIGQYLQAEALANAGDPGLVALRRLNNAEYTYTVQDLTGVPLHPAREFPADSAAGEGFTNAGNALAMSPALFGKYLDAGKEVAAHAVLLPDGFRFSRHATRRDWTDEILAEIRGLYRQYTSSSELGVGDAVGNVNVHRDTRLGQAGRIPLERYFSALLAERAALKGGRKTAARVARQYGLSERYLARLWTALNDPARSPVFDELRLRWRASGPSGAASLAATVAAMQKGLWVFAPVGLIGRQGGPKQWMEAVSPLVAEQEIRHRVAPDTGRDTVLWFSLSSAGDGEEGDIAFLHRPRLVAAGASDILLRDHAEATGLDPKLFADGDSLTLRAPAVLKITLPARLAAGLEFVTTARLDGKAGREGSIQVNLTTAASAPAAGLLPSEVSVNYSKVTRVFSDKRDISFVRPILVNEGSAARRRMEASMEAFRDLFPAAVCYAQIVPVDEVLTLTLFHREDGHLTRLLTDEAQRARLDRLWEDLHFVSQSPLHQLTALEMLIETFEGNGVADRSQHKAIEPLREPTRQRAEAFRKHLVDAEAKQFDALAAFAGRAYRRPVTTAESSELRGLYQRLRAQDLSHEDAFRRTLARVFVASPFLYRIEKAPESGSSGPVSDWELATRLSYFLWSSEPDEELKATAAKGILRRPAVLRAQARRMLADARVRRLATEFASQWLHIHEFDTQGDKSGKYFPGFEDLRSDMYEESIRFFTDLFQRDGSLIELLDADHTFLNERMAAFYGLKANGEGWRRRDGVRAAGRGGILGFAATLAKQSGASRTSPILRGNWVSEVLLGEKLPRPPKEVPQLPADETATDGLTMRELVTRHTSDPMCASCHRKIDPFGYALEGFDAIGRRRTHDLAGRPVDTRTTLPDGREIDGIDGLRQYLLKTRFDAFLRQFSRKLLGYAFGREVQLSDEPLLAEMKTSLARSRYRSSVLIDMIVESRQFREIRGDEASRQAAQRR